jgi:signal transduction histidine kinase
MVIPLPPNEAQRLQALHAYGLLDARPEAGFDEITALASYLSRAPIALFGLVDETRQCFKSCFGFQLSEIPRENSFCAYTILDPEGMVVADALADPRFAVNPLVQGAPGIRFYAGTPLLTRDGYALGALCVIDTQPRPRFAPHQHKTLQMLGRHLMTQIDHRYASAYLAQALAQRQREEAEEEARLRDRARQLERLNEMKDRFMALLAHELRNPLAPIINAVEILRSPEPRDSIEIIERQVKQLARLVNDLLDFSRAARGKIALNKTTLDLVSAVRSAARDAAPALAKRRQRFAIELGVEPLWAEADPMRLEQVVSNLLVNAAKFTPEEKSIQLTLGKEGGEAVLRVRDEGIGIAPEMQERIFDPFVQIGDSDSNQGGLGLGLPLVRQLIHLHGGTVEVHSEGAGLGSEFTVRFPLVEAPKTAQQFIASDAPAAAAAHLRVLVVDDNSDLGATLRQLLLLWGHEPALANCGSDALKKALEFRPDLVLIDIGLPRMDGYAVARALRAEPALNSTRLIAMSGYAEEADRARATQAGFHDFYIKPIDPGRLRELLTLQ